MPNCKPPDRVATSECNNKAAENIVSGDAAKIRSLFTLHCFSSICSGRKYLGCSYWNEDARTAFTTCP